MSRKYVSIWHEKRSLINTESHIRQYKFERDIFGSTHKTSLICAENGISEEFHLEKDNQRWIKIGSSLLEKNFADKLFKDGLALRKEFKIFIEEIRKKNLTRMTNQDLASAFEQACRYHSRLRGYFKITRPEFITQAEIELKKLIKTSRDVQKDFEILTMPAKMDEINLEFLDWLKILQKKQNRQILIDHIYKYPWLVAHSHKKSEIIKHLREKCEKDKTRTKLLRNDLKNLQIRKKQLLMNQNQILKRFDNNRINYFSWLFQEASLERMRLKGQWAGSDFLYLPIYEEISNRTKIPLADLYTYYRISDIISALKTHHRLTSDELKKRQQAYVLWLKNDRIKFYSGQEALAIIKKELAFLDEMRNLDLGGQIASKGWADGLVRIVIPGGLSDLKKMFKDFRDGEVLVTTMTQPNMVPIMKKAAAIVTDEGGLTSHAAIIAREFGIPCIVGTQVGTKVLKTGDRVEVDADAGQIKVKNDV